MFRSKIPYLGWEPQKNARLGWKYSAQKNDEEYAKYFFQLPGGSNAVERKPKRYSSADGAVDANDTTSYSSIKDEEQNNPRLVESREEAANRVIANMIRQIASLSEHAHGVFGINWYDYINGSSVLIEIHIQKFNSNSIKIHLIHYF